MTSPLTGLDAELIASMQPPCEAVLITLFSANPCERAAMWIVRHVCCLGHVSITLLCDRHTIALQNALRSADVPALRCTGCHHCRNATNTFELINTPP